ncbi:MAG: hypothetical protein A2284_13615 [Deltaproteobacteria bacterium RIFOXYA12_FULL_61_11]|nr:MAG: hypothetical protein A2284_13615 [Deltaproteobacteria bacterium RIFOXYA12_FULL_61_11]
MTFCRSVLLLLVSGILGCAGDDYFFLRHKGADMPIWVRGEPSSKLFLLLLHGGPGLTGQHLQILGGFERLERRYRLVYWDQRASGLSQGNAPASSVTLGQFVEDTALVIGLLRQRYDVRSVFLLGMSWGGAVGTAFCADSERAAMLDGWIDLDGTHHEREDLAASIAWVKLRAEDNITRGKRPGRWREVLSWYDRHPVIDPESGAIDDAEETTHYIHLDEAGAYLYDETVKPSPWSWKIFSFYGLGQYSFFAESLHQVDVYEKLDLDELDLWSEVEEITLPTLVLWGRHDGVIPLEQGEKAYGLLGSEDKSMVVFEQSAHGAPLEEPDAFSGAVSEFLETRRRDH